LDSMLGKLTHWLRLLGLEVLYSREFPDRVLVQESHPVVTRDAQLAYARITSGLPTVLLLADDLSTQLAVILRLLPEAPRPEDFPVVKYCTMCGSLLRELTPEEARTVPKVDDIPEDVFRTYSQFWYCPTCRKLYWRGSHHRKMRQMYVSALMLSRLLDLVCMSAAGRVCYVVLHI